MVTVKSPKFSFKGWKFVEWLKGNWTTIKEVVKVGAPLILSIKLVSTNPAIVSLITIGGKLVLDSLEYYIKEYKE